MNTRQLLLQRFHNQRLLQPSFIQPGELVAWMGAVQAQDYAQSKWALGLRLAKATDRTIEEAITGGSILRTHILRPTWHYVAPADIRWMLQLTAPRVQAFAAPYYKRLELDEAIFRKSRSLFEKLLSGGKHLSRTELAVAFGKEKISGQGERLNHILINAELEGWICSGPRKGKQNSYMLLEERVPPAAVPGREQSLATLATRYIQSHGPVTIKDFAWWSGLAQTDARRAIQLIASRLHNETIDGKEYWFFEPAAVKFRDAVYLIPNYDEYVVAYAGRDLLLGEGAALPRGGNPLFSNVIVHHGKIEGTWKRDISARIPTVTPDLPQTLSAAQQRRLDKAAAQYLRFVTG